MIRISEFQKLLDTALGILGGGAGRVEVVSGGRRVRVGRLMSVPGEDLPRGPAGVELSAAPASVGIVVRAPAVGVVSFTDNRTGRPLMEMGRQIAGGQTLAFITALEITTKVVAPRAGVVEEVFVEDGDGVEFNAPLLKLLPSD